MRKQQVGPILRELNSKSAVVELNDRDQQRVLALVAELKTIFDAYPKK